MLLLRAAGTTRLTALFAFLFRLPSGHLLTRVCEPTRVGNRDRHSHMRHIFGISVLLIAIGTVSCVVEGSATNTAARPPALTWVRTADGWERYGTWDLPVPTRPTLHPAVVAAGQLIVSTWALLMFRREEPLN